MNNKIVRLTVFLLLVTGICGAAIGYVNGVTAPVIARQDAEKLLQGFAEVYPEADEYRVVADGGQDSILVSEIVAIRDGQTAGVLYMVAPKGYGGEISMLVGFDVAKGVTTGLKILNQSETPGLGGNCVQPSFTGRFAGKTASRELRLVAGETSASDEVQAITASTKTSGAVVAGVNAARAAFVEKYGR